MSAGPPLLALERDGSGQTLRSYTHGVGLVSMLAGGQQHYVHGDALGSVNNVTSATGESEWTYAYEPYGTARSTTQDDPSAPANTIRFAGQYLDDSGLYNLKARMYDPSSGRLASRSPMPRDRAEPSVSTYSYVDNRPMARVSPNGMASVPPPATQGCGPGITLCSLRKLASEACPPPLTPYMGLPGFKPYWLAGYYAVCEGQRGMLREQLGQPGSQEHERDRACGGQDQAIGAAAITVGAGVIAFGVVPGLFGRGATWAGADLLSAISGPSLKHIGEISKGVFGISSIGYGIYCLAR